MNKPVLVSCDSACDLSPELREQYGIEVIAMYVNQGANTYRDGIDITPDDIYATYERDGVLPQTSAIPPEEYTVFFKSYTERGYAVVHVGLSTGVSCTCQNAAIAAAELEDVYVLDSLALSCGGGLLAIQACRMRDAGMEAREISHQIAKKIEVTRTAFIVGSLTYLAKGGRCSTVTALGANLLGIKPAIEMSEGTLSVGKKYRGKTEACFEKFLQEKLALARSESDRGTAFVYHAGISDDMLNYYVEMTKASGVFQEVISARAGSVISSHCGRETLGFTYQKKQGTR